LKGNWTRNQGGNWAIVPALETALKMISMFVIFENAFSIMTQLKSKTNRMADKTCMPACICRLWKLKQTLTLQPKTRNKKLFCYFVGVLCIFYCQKICILSRKQTNRKLKTYPRIKNCVRHAAKLGLLEQQTSLLIAMEFFSLQPAHLSSSCHAALHARSLGPP